MSIEQKMFGSLPDGTKIHLYTLTNTNGVRIQGNGIRCARLSAFRCQTARGNLGNVVLGHDTLEEYLADGDFLGAAVGRYANRIAGGKAEIVRDALFPKPERKWQHSARRFPGLPSEGLAAEMQQQRRRSAFDHLCLSQCGRRGGLPWESRRLHLLHLDDGQRPGDRLYSENRCIHTCKFDQSQLL